VFYDWLRQAFSDLAGALAPEAANEASKREKELVARNRELEAKLVKKDNVIAEISASSRGTWPSAPGSRPRRSASMSPRTSSEARASPHANVT
jgi:hypothetical protein